MDLFDLLFHNFRQLPPKQSLAPRTVSVSPRSLRLNEESRQEDLLQRKLGAMGIREKQHTLQLPQMLIVGRTH